MAGKAGPPLVVCTPNCTGKQAAPPAAGPAAGRSSSSTHPCEANPANAGPSAAQPPPQQAPAGAGRRRTAWLSAVDAASACKPACAVAAAPRRAAHRAGRHLRCCLASTSAVHAGSWPAAIGVAGAARATAVGVAAAARLGCGAAGGRGPAASLAPAAVLHAAHLDVTLPPSAVVAAAVCVVRRGGAITGQRLRLLLIF